MSFSLLFFAPRLAGGLALLLAVGPALAQPAARVLRVASVSDAVSLDPQRVSDICPFHPFLRSSWKYLDVDPVAQALQTHR